MDRLGIPSVVVADGPHGVRKPTPGGELTLDATEPATCFPTASGLAATWNRTLLREVGNALGREARFYGVDVLLGPGLNIKRHPLCGRNFEYFSEDPLLSGELAAAHIRGMADQGVGGCLKHFAANNQETRRLTVNAVVDERVLRELYLAGFETAVKKGNPASIMAAYNRLNGVYCSENRWLLTTVLREDWGFEGVVITDWGACNDRVAGVHAGLDLEMPGNGGINDSTVVEAVRSGALEETILDDTVRRMIQWTTTAEDARTTREGVSVEWDTHHRLARRAAAESCVLLKNDQALLPIEPDTEALKIAVIGSFAKHPRFQGAGSSQINAARVDDLLTEIAAIAPRVSVTYAPGYTITTDPDQDAPDDALISAAEEAARDADVALVFAGLPDAFESEGFDRTHMRLPDSHNTLIQRVTEAQRSTAVVLNNGSPVEMPWVDTVATIVESYLGGEAWAGAVADILFGRVNPSGKLAGTFPLRVEDTPAHLDFPGDRSEVRYGESVFVGYRGFDSRRQAVRFPFGHGLSFTSFEYSNLQVSTEGTTVRLTVTNTGTRAGAEVIQLYVHDRESSVVRPEQELKGFEKVFLEPRTSATVTFDLSHRSFAFWSTRDRDWIVEAGTFELRVGSSSRDIRCRALVQREAQPEIPRRYTANTMLGDILHHPVVGPHAKPLYDRLLSGFGTYQPGSPQARMFESMTAEMPLRGVVTFSHGTLLDREGLAALLAVLNGERPVDELPWHA